MALALPGQILVSSMAQALAQRAQAELGERAERVRWVSHGRYRFKGVPAPMLVHEVGEVGASPLQAAALGPQGLARAAAVAAPAGAGAGAAGAPRRGRLLSACSLFAQPAGAGLPAARLGGGRRPEQFHRDPRLDDSLDTALRIGLEQSRYVNVVPDLKVRSALQRMGREQPDAGRPRDRQRDRDARRRARAAAALGRRSRRPACA